MKIAFDHQIFSSQRFGGISRYFFELVKNLANYNDESIECLINTPLYINKYLKDSTSNLPVFGLPFPDVRLTGLLYKSINHFLSPIGFRGYQPDLVHETYFSSSSVAPHGCPIVLTVYDMIHELFPNYFPNVDRISEVKRKAVDRADHIICISDNTRQDLIRMFDVSPKKTSVVYLGCTLAPSSPIKLPYRDRPFLLYVGSRGGHKNFNRLLEAYGSHKKISNKYDLIAFGGGRFTIRELDIIHNYNLDETKVIHLAGDDSVLSRLYSEASIFVYPSLYEGFGIPPLEAMNLGCPVACSNTSSIPEVVGDAAVQFNPLDTESIGEALVRITDDSNLRENLITRGKSRVELFSWKHCAKDTFSVYQKVLQ